MSRKASDVSQQCFTCSLSSDGDFISCRYCSKTFHAKKDCSGVTASTCKAIMASENITYLCNSCKSFNLCELFDRLTSMEAEILDLKKQLSSSITSDIGNIVSNALKEQYDRQERRNNLMAFGMDESDEDNEEVKDEDNVSQLCVTLGVPRRMITSYSRVGRKKNGRSRPMRLRIRSFEDKVTCLRNSRKLKPAGVFLKHDLTPAQLAEEKPLVEELKRRRANGENAFIRNGMIVSNRKARTILD